MSTIESKKYAVAVKCNYVCVGKHYTLQSIRHNLHHTVPKAVYGRADLKPLHCPRQIFLYNCFYVLYNQGK